MTQKDFSSIYNSILASPFKSVSRLTFGGSDTLFIADWKESTIHAFTLPLAEHADDGKSYNLMNLDSILAQTLNKSDFIIEDMVKRPKSNEVYIAISCGAHKIPAIIYIIPDGTARILNAEKLQHSSMKLDNAPDEKLTFWNHIPGRSFTVTDMKWRSGELFVAGLSNQDFSSALWRLSYPFNGKSSTSSIEIYHAIHDQLETRAPIRAMTFVELEGQPYLLAAYTCTPLVTIPLENLKDGAHIHGKTIAELGYGNTPGTMISYEISGADGKKIPYILLTNLNSNADVMSVVSIEEANKAPGLSSPPEHLTDAAGVKSVRAPLVGVLRIDNQNDQLFVILRRNIMSGKLELISMQKGHAMFRLSDFVTEYTMPTYSYTPGKQLNFFKPFQDNMKRSEGYANLVSE